MIGDPPQPKDPEIIAAETICQEMRDIAKKLPKPERTQNEEKHTQFGNNFYLLFLAIKYEKSKPGAIIIEVYLKRIEKKYPEKWKKFLEDNTDLVAQIQEALKQYEISGELMRHYVMLLKNPKAQKLSDQIYEEINLGGIDSEIWNKLNPLLKQASEAMTLCGIKPEDFYG